MAWRHTTFAAVGASAICTFCYARRRLERLADEHRRDITVEKRLPSVAVAQKTAVVRLPRLLSDAEITQVHALHASVSSVCGKRIGDISANIMGSAYRTGAYLDNELPEPGWQVSYLSTGGHFRTSLPAVREKLIDAAKAVDLQHFGLLQVGRQVVPRCVEYHVVNPPGSLPHQDHFDEGSVLTIDVMLSDDEAFEGGEFSTLESDGEIVKHHFRKGDALVFVSHKPHHVAPVKSGQRRVLVIELWEGIERECGHRCSQHWATCSR
mmetsp:Transcript_62518/g.104048  ORF Transcript_62518/g.104048 Transcript_62518/m.104048 type:complete len:266 (-) Transcript_62518:156-953(-)